MSAPLAPGHLPGPSADSADLFDFSQIRDYLGFIRRAVGRHKLLVLGAWLSVMGVAAGALAMLPRSYHVETKILAQQNHVIAALGNPNRSVPRDADAPTRAASETVLRRDNLISLIKQTDLVDNWDATRAPANRVKDWLVKLVKGPPTEEDRVDALVGLLEKKLQVQIGDGTVIIMIDWPNDEMAFRLVEAAQQNFLEARHVSEISSISEAISILEGHAAGVREVIDGALERIQRFNDKKSQAVARPAAPSPARRALDREREQVNEMLTAKRRAIADLEDFRRKRLSELQTKLAELKASYSDAHPEVVHVQQSITALGQDSLQLADLKKEEEALKAGLVRLDQNIKEQPAAAAPGTEEAVRMGAEGGAPERASAADGEKEAQAVEFAKARVGVALSKYDELLERIDSAKIELATARAAFKYRYSVVRPAQRPKKADKPNVPVMLVLGAFAATALAMLAAVLADVRTGRILESWQVSRLIGVPVIAEVNRP
ncbi:MAG TPA: hypothetical protein VND93_26710 [Myxococcales bacterium]|nr:hypothetical protein [Myxococcales bacterium]